MIGREAERSRIDGLLEAARRGRTQCIVLAGEPGIGKTALLDDVCAGAAGMRVLRATSVESESALPYSGLHALLRPLLNLLTTLEEPQQRALRTALALADGDEPDLLAVNAGALSLLAEAASEQSLLVVVDDAHWLDAPSADALGFAVRRMQAEEVAFLFALRSEERSEFDRGFDRIVLGPLTRPRARELLELRREHVPPAAVERLLDLAAGNPLALLELPLAFATLDATDTATAPAELRRAFAERLDSLSGESRLALLLAAADPDAATVLRAAESLGLSREALSAPEAAGLLHIEPAGLVFRHPLVRSLSYADADPADRRAAHAALAAALGDDADRDRRAWHLAAAASGPDDALAALLEDTADRAAARGGHAAAGRALERAARLSEDAQARSRRLTRAARSFFWAGEVDRGAALTEEALAVTSDPVLRADALAEHASIRGTQVTALPEQRLLAALEEVEAVDPDRATRLLFLPVAWRSSALDVRGAIALTDRLERVARRAGPWWRPRGLANVAEVYLMAGDGARFSTLFEEVAGDERVVAAFAPSLIWSERYDEARLALEATLQTGRAAGNLMQVIWNQSCLADLELRLGRLRQARLAAAESISVGEAHEATLWVAGAQSVLAEVQAWQGDDADCRATAGAALAAARESGSAVIEFACRRALGLLAVGLGRTEDAVDELADAARRWWESSFREPSVVGFVPDLAEAYAHAGDTDEARLWLGRFADCAEQAERRWALAAVARVGGILAPADAFDAAFERSLELLDGSPLALERARTQLAFGERMRRAGRRREARAQLRAAHAAFAAVDAAPWTERAAAELRATGETVGPRTVDREARLTPQELQIARLAADGRTNREIAAQLYLSPKTIEYHLANAYRKLEIHSRVELARVLDA